MPDPSTGPSARPLVTKLGIGPQMVVGLVNAPEGFAVRLEPLPDGVRLVPDVRSRRDVAVAFFRHRGGIEQKLVALLRAIEPDGAVWIAWPKRTAARRLGIDTDITDDVVRELALPLGLVDVKVCAIDDVWTALRLVVRRERRGRSDA